MPIITNLEDKILQLIRSNQYQWFTVGVNLGGVSGEFGGSGIPLGGFVGQLIQSRVTYDTTEAEVWDLPVSGISLVDNLNRIRYRINTLEETAGSPLVVEDDSVQVASGVVYLNFTGGAVVTSPAADRVNVYIAGTGAGGGSTLGGETVVFEDLTNQIPAANNFYQVGHTVISGSLQVYVNGLVQRPTYFTETTSGFTTSETLVTTDELVAEYLTEVVENGLTILDTDNFVASGVTTLNFEGTTVTASGTTVTISGLGGSGGGVTDHGALTGLADDDHTQYALADGSRTFDINELQDVSQVIPISGHVLVYDGNVWYPDTVSGGGGSTDTKQAKVSSNDTTEGYLEDKIVAGTNVTVSVLNEGGNETFRITSTASGGSGSSVSILEVQVFS